MTVTLKTITPIKEVEIPLREFKEDHGTLHGTETGAETKATGTAFTDGHPEILASRNIGRLRVEAYVLEKLGILKATLTGFHALQVKDITGAERQFAQNDSCLGLGITLDIDGFDIELLALANAEDHIDAARLHIWNTLCAHIGLQITS